MALRRGFATTARRFTSSAELDALRILIREHDHAYYVLGTPSATDAEYDALFDSLRRTEAADPSLPVPPESPTQRVGGGLMDEAGDRARGVPHHAPMLSLESVRAEDRAETVERWSARVAKAMAAHDPSLIDDDADDDAQLKLAFAVEPKIDGVAVSLLYEEGKLVRALTPSWATTSPPASAPLKRCRCCCAAIRRASSRCAVRCTSGALLSPR